MAPWAFDVLYPVNLWVHIVATTLLVGGTLFYELVVPLAIGDLRDPQQVLVFAKARWVFRSVVRVSVVLLIISGAATIARMWPTYRLASPSGTPQTFPWMIAHVASGTVSIIIAMLLTTGGRPPARPIGWMRVNLVIMLVSIFLANVSRHIRLSSIERQTGVAGWWSRE